MVTGWNKIRHGNWTCKRSERLNGLHYAIKRCMQEGTHEDLIYQLIADIRSEIALEEVGIYTRQDWKLLSGKRLYKAHKPILLYTPLHIGAYGQWMESSPWSSTSQCGSLTVSLRSFKDQGLNLESQIVNKNFPSTLWSSMSLMRLSKSKSLPGMLRATIKKNQCG